MSSNKPPPSFLICLTGGDVSPESVPVRTLSDAASAVSKLAMGNVEDESAHAVRIIGVKRGSAVYSCVLDAETNTEQNLLNAGEAVKSPESTMLTYPMLRPIEQLSRVARKLECQIQIRLPSSKVNALVVNSDSYDRIRQVSLVGDEATVSGTLVRVGGAVERKCAIRVAGRDKLLICRVGSQKLSQELGRRLYEPVTLYGRGMYFSRTWDLLSLNVDRATYAGPLDYDEEVSKFRELTGGAWDDVGDVAGELRSMR